VKQDVGSLELKSSIGFLSKEVRTETIPPLLKREILTPMHPPGLLSEHVNLWLCNGSNVMC
jgi:hypothetical protein